MPTSNSTSISANDPRLANLAAAFGGTDKSAFTDFLKIVNASPDYIQQLNSYLDHGDGRSINTASELNPVGADSKPMAAGGVTDPTSGTITVSTSSIRNDLFSSAGYKLAVTIAHELGHSNDPDILNDGVVSEAKAEINAYNLMSQAVGNLNSNGDTASTAIPGGALFEADSTGKPISGLSSFKDAQNVIEQFSNAAAPSDLNSTSGQSAARLAAVAKVLSNNEYKNYYQNSSAPQTAPQILSQNGDYQLVTDLTNPDNINVVDTQTGQTVQVISVSATTSGALSLSVSDLIKQSSWGVKTNDAGQDTQTDNRTTNDGVTTDDLKNFSESGSVQNEVQTDTTQNGQVSATISGTGAIDTVSNAAITVTAGSQVTLTGTNNTVTAGNASSINLTNNSNNNNITVGTKSTVSVADNDRDTVISASADTISLGSNTNTTINGANDSITTGTATSVTTDGAGVQINLGSNSNLTVSGGSVTATLNNGSLVVGSGSAVVLNGSTDVVSASDNSTVTVAGAGNTLNVSGAGVTTTESGYSNTLNISGTSDSTTATGTGTSVNVNGWKDSTGINGQNDIVTVTGSGNDNTSISGTSDTATVRGNYDVTTISGWKDNSTIQGQGDSTYVTGSGNDNTYVSGTSDGTVVSGSYDQTAVNGWKDTSFINGQGDSTYVTGSGNDNTYVSGTSDGTEVSGNYDQTNVSGWMDNSFIKGQGDSTNVSGSGNDDTYITGTSDGTTVTGNYDETVVGGWMDDSYIQGQGDSTYVTGSGNDNTYVSGISDGTLVTGNYDETVSSGSDNSETIEGQGDVTPTPSGDGDTVDYGGTLDAPSSPDMPDDPFDDDDDPLILSLNKDPVKTQGLSNTAAVFDMQNTGQAVKTGWGTAGEGYLVYDPNDAADSTVVKQDHQLVAGFSALQALAQAVDGTSKGWLNGSDSLWGDLKVWVDTTGTGQFQQGQLMSLDQLGITGIDLNASTVHENSNGNTILSDGRYMLASGETGDIAGVDLVFNTDASAGAANKVTQLIQAMASYSPESSSSTVISPDLSTAQQTLLATPH